MSESRGVYHEWHKIRNKEKTETLEHGPKRHWYVDGHLEYEYNYKDGGLDGSWKEWYENGQLHYFKNYSDGLKNSTFEKYCKDGGTIEIENYKDDYRNGEQFIYYYDTVMDIDPDGVITIDYAECNNVLREKGTFKEGVEDGMQYFYYDGSGDLKATVPYVDGTVHGTVTKYNEEGESATCEFNMGATSSQGCIVSNGYW